MPPNLRHLPSQDALAVRIRVEPSRTRTSVSINIGHRNQRASEFHPSSSSRTSKKPAFAPEATLKPRPAEKVDSHSTARSPRSRPHRVKFEKGIHPTRQSGERPLKSPPPPPHVRRYRVRYRHTQASVPPSTLQPKKEATPLTQDRERRLRSSDVRQLDESLQKDILKIESLERLQSDDKPILYVKPTMSSMVTYNSTVLTLVKQSTADPFVVAAHGQFFLIFTTGDHIEIWSAPSLANFNDNFKITSIWRPPPGTEHSDGLWAPELHCIQGRWWVYYAAAHPRLGNKSHRMWVLAGPPASQDPTTGNWEFAGPIQGMPTDQWAIDGTVFELAGQLYFVYSGWPIGVRDNDLLQRLFIIRLLSPTVASPNPVEICRPDKPWEFSHDGNGAHGINEGPQFLESPDGSWKGLVYSCAGSWTKDYKMALLHYRGGDPLNPASWYKDTRPLLETAPGSRGPWGPGHGSFLHLGNETLAIYHATDKPTDGWANRRARVQRVIWTMHGPNMGSYCGPLTNDFELFSKGGPVPETRPTPPTGFRALFGTAKHIMRNL